MIDTSPTHPVSTLSDDPAALFQQLKSSHHPITLTIDGHPEFVIQEAAAYQRLLDIAAEADANEGIRQGLEELDHGKGRPVAEFIEEFRATHGIPR